METFAQFLIGHRQSIGRRWLGRVRSQLPTEHVLDEQEILDSLFAFLEEVVKGLESEQPLPQLGADVAQAHGAQRQLLQRDIDDVVREYGLLFESVIDECRQSESGPFRPDEYGRLAGLLNRGAAEAVRQFADLQALELRRQAWEHFAFIAHEIRNPLQTARTASQLLRVGSNPQRTAEVLERSLAQLSETIDQALVDARLRGIDAGAPLHTEPTELRALLSAAVDDSRADAEARQISIALEAPRPVKVDADPRVLRSVISNLVRNAVKFTRSGGKVTVRVSPGTTEIEDQCGGLRPGDEERIFDSFRQSGDDRSGFGLGLAIARQGIEAHGGSVHVRNLPGQGCVFVMTLPGSR